MADNPIPAIREHLRGAALEALSFSQMQAARGSRRSLPVCRAIIDSTLFNQIA
jgi:hypothetical protein